MPVRKRTLCALCDEPSPQKMATMYWAWTWPSQDRRCYKQFFDATCFASVVSKLNQSDMTDICFFCHELAATIDDINLYATYYVPGQERRDGFGTMHPACLEKGEQYFLQNAVRMPNRGSGSNPDAPRGRGNPWDAWDTQGLRPL